MAMNIIILKTSIDNAEKLNAAKSLFERIPEIRKWSVDQEDVDNVLRIEAAETLTELKVMELTSNHGLICQELV